MVRVYKKKTERAKIDEKAMNCAIEDVIEGRLSIRIAAEKYNVKAPTLQHRVEKKRAEANGEEKKDFFSKYSSQQVFTAAQEKHLNEYIIKCSKMHYGLTLLQVRQLAYEYAKKLECHYPSSWDIKKCAGVDWAFGFRNRNKNISLRKPENTSVARSFSFNKSAVAEFYTNLENLLKIHHFTADRIVNFDETGITTVLNTPKVLAEKTQRQVGQIVSSERGELITFGGIITAIGNTIPPIFVFPRVNYKSHFLLGSPEGSLGLASRTGWINGDLFLEVLKHIQKHMNSTTERPILLLCDNHESHISIEAINYSRENGIVYLSFPPHTSHKLQPLDVAVFGPFKCKLKVAFNDWHINHPGKALSIYEIPPLAKLAYFESFTVKNITSAFTKPGIWPFNKLAFSDDDFAPCDVYINKQSQDNTTDVDLELQISTSNDIEPESHLTLTLTPRHFTPPPIDIDAKRLVQPEPIPSTSNAITPESVRPLPKIIKTVLKRKGKEKGKSRIYTNTPEKERLEELAKIKELKRNKKEQIQRIKELKTARKLLGLCPESDVRAKKIKKRKLSEISSSSSSCTSDFEVKDFSSDSNFCPSEDEASDNQLTPIKIKPENLKEGDFVLIKFEKKKSIKHYVGKILLKYDSSEYQVSYLRKKPSGSFVFPDVKDEASVNITDIILQLPMPTVTNGTNRTASLFYFKFKQFCYNL